MISGFLSAGLGNVKNNDGFKLSVNCFIVATIPVMIIGYFLSKSNFAFLRSEATIGWSFIIFGIFLFITDKIGLTIRKFEHCSFIDAVVVGLFQTLALIPGTSRSGITISAARILGFERSEAARFSMILSIPTIVAAGALISWKIYQAGDIVLTSAALAVGGISCICALLSLVVLMWWIKKASYTPFVIYRILFGAFLLANHYGYISVF
jgi:undecaprenyl-diphosphatase